MTKLLLRFAAVLAATVSVFASCKPDPIPEVTEYETVFETADAVYTETTDGVSHFTVDIKNSNLFQEDVRYSNVSFTLNSEEINIQYFDIPVGTYEFSNSGAAGTAEAGFALDTKKDGTTTGEKVSIVDGKITVRNQQISGEVTLENGHTLSFTTAKNYALTSLNPLPDFLFELKNNSFIDYEILIRPTDRKMDFFNVVMPADRFAGKTDDAVLSEIHEFSRNIISMGMTDKDNTTVNSSSAGILNPVTEYCLYAYGVKDKEPSTALYTFKFTTSDQNDPTNVTFTSAVEDITKNSAYVQVTPSDNTVLYVWDVVKKEAFDKYGKVEGDFLTDWLKNQIDGSYWKTIEDVVAGCGMRGVQDYEYTTLASGTDYLVFAVCVDASGKAVSKAYVSDVFTTEQAKVSDAYVYQDMVAYYDGDALAAADPVKYAKYAGMYYVHTELVIDGGEPVIAYAGHTSDNPDDYSDEALIAALVKSGVKCDLSKTKDVWSLVKKNGAITTMNTITVGQDAAGDFGAVDRYPMYLMPKSCSPISDIIGE
ncbi:MAG: hypothetical protein MJZ16_04355 [Bacteroidales bacterium]|nr:hypothetical protein [Bacteroidales bacterium]